MWSVPGFYTVSLTVSSQGDSDTESRKVLVESAAPAGTCVSDAETLCLRDSRFSVALEWWTADDQRGVGCAIHEGTNDSGLFDAGRDAWPLECSATSATGCQAPGASTNAVATRTATCSGSSRGPR